MGGKTIELLVVLAVVEGKTGSTAVDNEIGRK